MKQFISLMLYALLWTSCLTANRIRTVKPAVENSFTLEQSADFYSLHGKNEQSMPSKVKITYRYFDTDNKNIRPEVTACFQFKDIRNIEIPDSVVFINLDDENISLFSAKEGMQNNRLSSFNNNPMSGTYVIPENLWVPIVHSHKMAYRLTGNRVEMEVRFNESQKERLSEFLERALKQNSEKFPAVPEGQVKW